MYESHFGACQLILLPHLAFQILLEIVNTFSSCILVQLLKKIDLIAAYIEKVVGFQRDPLPLAKVTYLTDVLSCPQASQMASSLAPPLRGFSTFFHLSHSTNLVMLIIILILMLLMII